MWHSFQTNETAVLGDAYKLLCHAWLFKKQPLLRSSYYLGTTTTTTWGMIIHRHMDMSTKVAIMGAIHATTHFGLHLCGGGNICLFVSDSDMY